MKTKTSWKPVLPPYFCSGCKAQKTVNDFYPKAVHSHKCKLCVGAYNKAWKSAHPLMAKAQKLRANYGLDYEKFKEMQLRQNNRCAICFKEDELVVDHNHATKQVRGLLCRTCNQGLGLFKENTAALRNAATYLEDSSVFGQVLPS